MKQQQKKQLKLRSQKKISFINYVLRTTEPSCPTYARQLTRPALVN